MRSIIKNKLENIIVDKMINKAVNIAKQSELGYSLTGCQAQQLSIAVLLYECSRNDVMFNDTQLNNINVILNTI